MSLFDVSENKKQEKLEETLDRLKEKFGYNSITRAVNLDKEIEIKLN